MKSKRITEFLSSRIRAKDFPSAVYLVAEKGEIMFQDALGLAVVKPERIEAKTDTIYDLASLTKPLVTALLCAKLIEEDNLKTRVVEHLPDFDYASRHPQTGKDIETRDLLCHRSGFPAWKPLYLVCQSRKLVLNAILDTPLKSKGGKVEYSDLNYIILTVLLEKFYGQRLDDIARKEIFKPLGLKRTFYNPLKFLKRNIAASELGNFYEKQMASGYQFDVSKYDWRTQMIWGEVHDGNACFMKGVSGHSGVFSNAGEVFKIAQQFLAGQTTLLKPETCELFRTNFTKGMNEARSIGFQLAETPNSTAGKHLSKDSFGHLGFTGTSVWIEPETERIFILLTNRIHNRRLPFPNINSVRRHFHELAVEELNRI